MQHVHHELTGVDAGDVVKVDLTGNAANVRLLDHSNYHAYAADRQHRYIGGHYTRSPVVLRVPSPGTWHVAVDLGGHAGQVGCKVTVIRPT